MTASGPRPGRPGQMLAMWLSIYPALTLTLWLFEVVGLSHLALPLRTLVLTVVLVPAMVYLVMPAVMKALKRVTQAESSGES